MARSGLTKSQVREARDRLLAEGRHPSVDAVRHALGDSGSKSTIHKYLKELRSEDGGGDVAPGLRREDTGRALHALVDQLADRLHADFDERMLLLRAAHDDALRERDRELAELRNTVATLTAPKRSSTPTSHRCAPGPTASARRAASATSATSTAAC
ncbi:MAG: DNA-binding protein [Massilia sp.]|nr:DNA-binding protein [Massilia sp.]